VSNKTDPLLHRYCTDRWVNTVFFIPVINHLFIFSFTKLPPNTLAGFDLSTNCSNFRNDSTCRRGRAPINSLNALAAWSSGTASASGDMDREIESRQGIGR
jgi:hypothetical protein